MATYEQYPSPTEWSNSQYVSHPHEFPNLQPEYPTVGEQIPDFFFGELDGGSGNIGLYSLAYAVQAIAQVILVCYLWKVKTLYG